jgi:very-short-patch-repair endonuclease
MNINKEYKIDIKNKILKYYDCDIIIDDNEPYFYINAKNLAKILNIKNIIMAISNYDKNEKKIIKTQTKGGPQNVNYLTFEGFYKYLCSSRNIEIINFCKNIGIEINTKIYTSIETDTLKCIIDTFNNEKIFLQYKVNQYRIDLYFEEKKIAIECDESQHNKTNNIIFDKIREDNIKKELDCKFIRYKPYDKNFNIFKLLNEIYINIK